MDGINLQSVLQDPTISFSEKVWKVYLYQFQHVVVFRRFCIKLNRTPDSIQSIEAIPFMPIDVFKQEVVISDEFDLPNCVLFQSSGTSKQERSSHYLADSDWYTSLAWKNYQSNYNIHFPIYAYVPKYSDNPHSSLVFMLNFFVEKTNGAFLPLDSTAIHQIPTEKPIVLFGAAFGLLDIIENHPIKLHHESIIIETGGMKTHRKEIERSELHHQLSVGFGIEKNQIHSEYGMAEILSQSYYTKNKQGFEPSILKQIKVVNPLNPYEYYEPEKKGQIAIIDLANVFSVSFILTEDEGLVHQDESFSILGRLISSEMRGCNFLLERD